MEVEMEVQNATDTIEVYEQGKTWDCDCSHGIGTEKDVRYVKCQSCGDVLEDEEYYKREGQGVDRADNGQMELGAFT